MEQARGQALQRTPENGSTVSGTVTGTTHTRAPEKFLKLTCSMCSNPFVLDLEEDWGAPPEEIELEGRDFLGIHEDDVLCPRCTHSVEVAGAERVYWRLAHR